MCCHLSRYSNASGSVYFSLISPMVTVFQVFCISSFCLVDAAVWEQNTIQVTRNRLWISSQRNSSLNWMQKSSSHKTRLNLSSFSIISSEKCKMIILVIIIIPSFIIFFGFVCYTYFCFPIRNLDEISRQTHPVYYLRQ